MSSTNRGGVRSPADFYPTPAWCVARLLEATDLPGGHWLEPCAGDGAILRAVNAVRGDLRWSAVELRPACAPALRQALGPQGRLHTGSLFSAQDFLAQDPASVLITNPPFRLAREVLALGLAQDATVVLLLRLNFLASAGRAEQMRRHAPDVYVLPNRPSFAGGGRTDSVEYGWFVWPRGQRERSSGSLQVLAPTPARERRPSTGARLSKVV